MRLPIAFAILLTACVPEPTPPPPPAAPVVTQTAPVAAVAPIPRDPVAAVAVLPPSSLPGAAAKSLTDASDYVAWKSARVENIDRLTVLAGAVVKTRHAMVTGGYRHADVVAARHALLDLRMFLRVKGD